MDADIVKRLTAETYDPEMEKLKTDLLKMLRRSRGSMKTHFPRWNRNQSVFKGERVADEGDREAMANDEPAKLTVPLTYTQVMTWVTFTFMLYKQSATFFQLDADGNEDYPLTEISETFLERDLRHNYWDSILFQCLLDAGRYGFTATKTTWKKQTQFVNVVVPATPGDENGIGATAESMMPKSVLKYEGNEIVKISPYRALPDLSLPLTRWREGRFFADECEFHVQHLKDLEEMGELAGMEFVTKMGPKEFEEGKWDMGLFSEDVFGKQTNSGTGVDDEDDFMIVSTEGHFRLIPSKYRLGPEKHLVDFIVNIANDQRIVKLQRLEHVHGDFIYDLGLFLPDEQSKLGMALCDQIDALQQVVTFLFNSRVVSLRAGVEKHIVVDPTKFEMVDIEGRSPIIRTKKNTAMMGGIANYIQQLKYNDGTTMNMQEADGIMRIIQNITGVNENAMGQYAPGRRSAAENRAANSGASSRMTLHASLLWTDMFASLGRKMLLNLRQGVSVETFEKVLGKTSPTPGYDLTPEQAMQTAQMEMEQQQMMMQQMAAAGMPAQMMPQPQVRPSLYEMFCAPLEELVGSNDFLVFSATSPSERVFLSQSLQELVMAMMSNPEVVQLTGYNLTKLIDEIQFLRGIRNTNRFKQPSGAVGALGARQVPVAGATGQAGEAGDESGVPDDDAET